MGELKIVEILLEYFPDKKVPENFFPIIAKKISSHDIYKLAKAQGLSTTKWLISKGFEYVGRERIDPHKDIEPTMELRTGPEYACPDSLNDNNCAIHMLLTDTFYNQPLLGNTMLTPGQSDYLFKKATLALQRGINEGCLIPFDEDILVLKTIHLLKNWNYDEREQDEEKDTFWSYICEQYGIDCNRSFGNTKAYAIFKRAVKGVMERHRRFFAPSGKKYYTTLLTHALAPKGSFFSLFEIIFSFYADNLQYQYFAEDTAYLAFSHAMQARVDGEKAQDLHIKYAPLTSSVKILFQQSPCFMRYFVENIVRQIDNLLTGQFVKQSYLDHLLEEWFESKSAVERNRSSRSRSRKSNEYVATNRERIRLHYSLKDQKELVVLIPAIRIGENKSILPRIEVLQTDVVVLEKTMPIYGDHICITSDRMSLSYSDFHLDAEQDVLNIRIVIKYGEETIYDSGENLFRDCITFSGVGNEQLPSINKAEKIYLFAMPAAEVEFHNVEYHRIVGDGQLFSLHLKDASRIVVNQVEMYSAGQQNGSIRISTIPLSRSYVTYIYNEREFQIFTKDPLLTIQLADSESEKQYQIRIDGNSYGLGEFEFIALKPQRSYEIELPSGSDLHEVRVINLTAQYAEYSLQYVVIPGFRYMFDEPFYKDCEINSCITIHTSDTSKKMSFQTIAGDRNTFFSFHNGLIRIDLPQFCCELGAENVFLNPQQTLWYKNIEMSECLNLKLPSGYQCVIDIGQKQYSIDDDNEKFEIGNVLHTIDSENKESVLVKAVLQSPNGQIFCFPLFHIAFKPCFIFTPLEIIDGELRWYPEENYIGNPTPEFKVTLRDKGDELITYSLSNEKKIVEKNFPFGGGIFYFDVRIETRSFFTSQDQIIHQGKLTFGDPKRFFFNGKAFIITKALLINEENVLQTHDLNKDSGLALELKYCGDSIVNGEDIPYPCYEGTLCYKNGSQLRQYADRSYEKRGIVREAVNPIKIWIINERILAIRDTDNDGLYVNTYYPSITDRKPTPQYRLSYINPDYYEYQIVEHSDVIPK